MRASRSICACCSRCSLVLVSASRTSPTASSPSCCCGRTSRPPASPTLRCSSTSPPAAAAVLPCRRHGYCGGGGHGGGGRRRLLGSIGRRCCRGRYCRKLFLFGRNWMHIAPRKLVGFRVRLHPPPAIAGRYVLAKQEERDGRHEAVRCSRVHLRGASARIRALGSLHSPASPSPSAPLAPRIACPSHQDDVRL